MNGTTKWVVGVGIAALAFVGGCASDGGADDVGVSASQEPLLGAPVPPEVRRALASAHRHMSDEELDEVRHYDHFVWVGPERRVHVIESYTLRSWLRWPHRSVLLLPGTFVTGSWYDIDVDGYRFADTLAQRGLFAFAVDYEGTGLSTYPDDGYTVDHDYLVTANRRVLRWIRAGRLVPRVDVLGESNGGGVAMELCADAHRVRSCVVSSMLYVEPTDFYNTVFLDPGLVGFLSSQPDGYLDATPDLYFNIVAIMTPEVRDFTLATQPGRYALGYVIDPFPGLPWYDPTHAAVPGLILQGTNDNVATQHDIDLLAAAYGSVGGGEATVYRIEGAGHIPRVEPPPYNELWTDAVIDFLDPR